MSRQTLIQNWSKALAGQLSRYAAPKSPYWLQDPVKEAIAYDVLTAPDALAWKPDPALAHIRRLQNSQMQLEQAHILWCVDYTNTLARGGRTFMRRLAGMCSARGLRLELDKTQDKHKLCVTFLDCRGAELELSFDLSSPWEQDAFKAEHLDPYMEPDGPLAYPPERCARTKELFKWRR